MYIKPRDRIIDQYLVYGESNSYPYELFWHGGPSDPFLKKLFRTLHIAQVYEFVDLDELVRYVDWGYMSLLKFSNNVDTQHLQHRALSGHVHWDLGSLE